MSNEYYQLIVTIDSKEAIVIEGISQVLFDLGALGTQVNYAQGYLENHPNLFGEIPEKLPQEILDHATEIVGYFQEDPSALIETCCQELSPWVQGKDYQVTSQSFANQDWQRNWMDYYQPQVISRFLSVVPIWKKDDYKRRPGEQLIFLDPGVSFGTGSHPTTQLSAQALELVMSGGELVLDVGTGSGILSFIAASLGAREVHGYDLDPQAIESAKDNLRYQSANDNIQALIDQAKIDFQVNDLLEGQDYQADIIVANIVPNILVNLFEDAYKKLVAGGYLIIGGILEEKAEDLLLELEKYPFDLYQIHQYQNWVGIILQKPGDY
ncbi:50S ribosomal protein L11 methyltransferase [Hutsoniella sourekii]|uniref:50S ribosomal protein L11 methyltransferase n=1 Tax=Hutsoniella sourekii TaxID=87650 RepID=UPI0004AEEA42|nr:50S ribosomal protein L11 methyltransferase [Hutsoniella sourekii]